jgi:hypothetical protein
VTLEAMSRQTSVMRLMARSSRPVETASLMRASFERQRVDLSPSFGKLARHVSATSA